MTQIVQGIKAIPKQQFTVVLDNVLWDITLTEAAGIMAATIKSGGDVTPVTSGQRCVANALIIPRERENGGGNFAIFTPFDELPWWENFGATQSLIYFSPVELAAVRNGN